jgi:gas vesicle protein
MSTRKIVLGTMAGITLGAVGGYLVASGKGTQMYNQIKNTAGKIKDTAGNYVDQFASKLDAQVDAAKDNYSDIKDNVEDLAQKGKTKYEQTKKELKTAANDFNQLSS